MNLEHEQKNIVFNIIYKRILFLIIIILAISIVFGILSFFRSQGYYSEIIYKKQVERLNFVNTSFEKEIEIIKRLQYNVMMNENVDKIRYFYDTSTVFEQYQMIQSVMEELQTIKNSSRIVSGTKIYFKNIQRVISADDFNKIDELEWAKVKQELYGFSTPLVHYQNTLVTSEALPVFDLNATETPDCILIVELDKQAIEQILKYAQLTDEDIVVLVDRDSGKIVSSTDNEYITVGSTKTFSNEMLLNDERFRVIRSTSQLLNLEIYWLYIDSMDRELIARGIIFLGIFLLVIGFIILSGFLVSYRSVYHPLKILLEDAFDQVRSGNFKYRITMNKSAPFSYLYKSFNDMVSQIDYLVEKDLSQQLLISNAQLKQLQAQINPHFMYNSYYVLYRMIKMKDYANSVIYCEHLGKFYEYITRDGDDEKLLKDEIEHIRVYTSIQSYRFRERIHSEIDTLPDHWSYTSVPRLILQPLVENAFQYVFEKESSASIRLLRISFHETAGNRIIRVENSGELDDERLKEIKEMVEQGNRNGQVTALSNIEKRLRIYFDGYAGLNISRSNLGGLCVEIYFPDREEY